MDKKIALIWVHNLCHSQIDEIFGKQFANDKYDFYSAETETKPQINQDTVRLMKQLYGIDVRSVLQIFSFLSVRRRKFHFGAEFVYIMKLKIVNRLVSNPSPL